MDIVAIWNILVTVGGGLSMALNEDFFAYSGWYIVMFNLMTFFSE